MSVLQMQRISICAMKKDRKAILKDLQGFGAIEIETSKSRRGRTYEDGHTGRQTEV